MTVRRVMGIETEYGIVCPGHPEISPQELSGRIVAAYGGACRDLGMTDDVIWDFDGESPLADARGFSYERDQVDPSLLTDDPSHPAPPGPETLAEGRSAIWLARLNDQEARAQRGTTKVLTNGARWYVDHAHPEYSAPETTTPRDAVLWDRAGELVCARAMASVRASGAPEVVLYKNSCDGKGAAYGCHENYQVQRALPFQTLVDALVPFFVTRPVICGAGRVGLGPTSAIPGYQISQRADYVAQVTAIQTTYDRPIINTRDEPHADAGLWRRLHVIGGDANCMPASTLLKMGVTSLVLWVLENFGLPEAWRRLELADPVAECSPVSHDISLTHRLTLTDGRRLTALQIQREYLDAVLAHLAPADQLDADTREIVDLWSGVLDTLGSDILAAADRVEWVAKLALLQAKAARDELGWSSVELAAMDLQWADLRPERSIVRRLMLAGRIDPMFGSDQIARAEFDPPADTRAWFRGEAIKRWPDQVHSASWHSIVLELHRLSMLRIPMTNAVGGTRAKLGGLLDSTPALDDVVAVLTGRRPDETAPTRRF